MCASNAVHIDYGTSTVLERVYCSGAANPYIIQSAYSSLSQVCCDGGTGTIFSITGNGVVLNTSLNRRGEPMVCSPSDALDMFFGSDLQYLVMEDILVTKEGVPQ